MSAEPTTWPRKWTLVCKCTLFKIEGDAHLGYPVCSSFQTNIVLLWVWSKSNKSSAMQVTPGIPARTVHMRFWKYSVAEVMPNGSWLKQNRPKGVMKVRGALILRVFGSVRSLSSCPTFAPLVGPRFVPHMEECGVSSA